jgi:hypothetical protein
MERNIYRKDEVISFLEEKVLMDIATQEELNLYEIYIWSGKLVKGYTYKLLVRQMRRLYDEKY